MLAVGLLLFAFTYEGVLRGIGNYLVESEGPVKADAILVLAGDSRGQRVRTAGELVASGYAPVALVSGPMEIYGVNEADLAVRYAVRQGFPAAHFEAVHVRALSTLEEAQAFAPVLRQRNVRKLLLITSNYHTRRAAAVFRRVLGPNVEVRSVAAPDKFFDPESWWQNREGQKTLFYEYSKSIADRLGM